MNMQIKFSIFWNTCSEWNFNERKLLMVIYQNINRIALTPFKTL